MNDSEAKSQRSQRKLTWKVTQEADDGMKRCAGSKSKKGAKGGGKKIEDGVGDRIGERVGEGIYRGLGEVIDVSQNRNGGKSEGAKGMESEVEMGS